MARAAGVSRAQLRTSAYRRLLHDVYVEADVPDSVPLRAAGAALVLPPDAVVGYSSAAWLHGADLIDRRLPDLDVIAQRGDQIRRNGIRATSALLEPGEVTSVFGVPVTAPARTAFDLARRAPDLIEAVVALDAMLNRGGCSLDGLAEQMARCGRWRGVAKVRYALPHAEPLSESPMETRQRMRLVLAGLPRPRAQVPVEERDVVFAYIDNGYEEFRVGTDYDGEDHEKRWRYDLERQERVRDQGWWHRRYTSLHIRGGWRQMVDQVGQALVAAGWRPT